MERLTRRQLVARGGAAAGAAALGSLALARDANRTQPGPPAPPAGAARPLKGIALGGFGALRSPHDPNDYLEWGNREYVRASHTDVVRMQVSWRFLQPVAPASRAASWQQLDREHGGAGLRRLDRQIAAANRDGVRVILGLYHSYPEWSNGTQPGSVEPVSGKPSDARFPLDLSPESPWAWFVEYLCDRYGGPSRPHIWGLEICNEPNLLCWPQLGVVDAVAAMANTAARAAAGRPYPALLLLPGTSDFPDADVLKQGVTVATGWPSFTAGVLDRLRSLDTTGAALPAWSHHNYRDAKVADGRSDRARQVIAMLAARGWPGERRLYLTEGGVDIDRLAPSHCLELDLPASDDRGARELCQARLIRESFAAMSIPEIALWTQYKLNDQRSDVTTASGLRRDFVEGAGPGAPRPAWYVWLDI